MVVLGEGSVIFTKNIVRLLFTLSLIGVLFYFVIRQNQSYQYHFNRIIIGRADRSSEGRFDLWGRGIDVLIDRQIGIWGIGPENFRVVDWQSKQLHNDVLAFLVERGLLGTFGLVGVGVLAFSKALNLLMVNPKFPGRARIVGVIFLAAITATLVESLTHQIFHDRQLWLILALQEAMLLKRTLSEGGLESNIRTLSESWLRPYRPLVRSDVTDG
jgi:O-antigen ligase